MRGLTHKTRPDSTPTAKGNMTLNGAAGSHDDYVAALALAWFGVQNCAGSLGPPRSVRW